MSRPPYLLAIDQGTTSTRAIVFDADGAVGAQAQIELDQIYPQDGWVEHDPEEIWRATVAVCRRVLAEQDLDAGDIAGIGIANQRETTILWERASGAESRMYIPAGRFKNILSIQVTGFISEEIYGRIMDEYQQELMRRLEAGR